MTALVQIFLMMLLYILFLSVDMRGIGRSFTNIRFTTAALSLNFVITPVLAFVLGTVFFSGSVDLRIGLIMLLVTPCTDWYLVFTKITGGNVELGMSILPLNLVLQIVLLPVYLTVFVGGDATMDVQSLLMDMVAVLAIPFVAAMVTRAVTKDRPTFSGFMDSHGDDLQLLFLCLAVVPMFASEGDTLLAHPDLLLEMFVPLLLFFIIMFLTSQAVGRVMGFLYADRVALTFTSMARNSPLSLAVAVTTFPDQPLVALALVIGPLIELPMLALASWALRRFWGGRGGAEATVRHRAV